MCAEASTVLRAVAADFFSNCWYLEIPSDNRIRHIPRCVHHHAQGFKGGIIGYDVLSVKVYFLLFGDGLAYPSTLKTEAVRFSEESVSAYLSIWHCIQEYSDLETKKLETRIWITSKIFTVGTVHTGKNTE
jgi:hypothetical protein